MKKIIIIACYCDLDTNPNNRFTSICDMLVQDNNSVELITSSFNHTKKKQKEVVSNNEYRITYIRDIGYTKNVSIRRIISIFLLSKGLKRYLKQMDADIVFCAAPPLCISKVALDNCRKKNITMALDVQDLWPEAFEMVASNKALSVLYKLLKKEANYIYSKVAIMFTVSDTYSKRVDSVRKKNDVQTVYLGIDMRQFDDTNERINMRNNGHLKIVYIGTLGHSYDIPTLLCSVKKLNEADCFIELLIIGDGPKMEEFKELSVAIGVSNVFFVGRIPYKEMTEIIKDCDIAVNPIVHGSAGSVINKVCDYAAAGLPVVNSQENAEYRELINRYNAGINVECENSDSMYRGLRNLIDNKDLRIEMSRNSRKMAEELFDRRTTYKKIRDILTEERGFTDETE